MKCLALLAAVALAGCADDDTECQHSVSTMLSIGDGFNGIFEPIDADDRILVLINGHGQYGIDVAVRAAGLVPDDVEVSIRVTLGEDTVAGTDVSMADGSYPVAEPTYAFEGSVESAELVSAPVVFRADIPPIEYLNTPVSLTLRAEDGCGTTAELERRVIPWWQY